MSFDISTQQVIITKMQKLFFITLALVIVLVNSSAIPENKGINAEDSLVENTDSNHDLDTAQFYGYGFGYPRVLPVPVPVPVPVPMLGLGGMFPPPIGVPYGGIF